MTDPRGRQAVFNESSRGQWEGFAGHRLRVSALLGAGSPPAGTRLCVLGVGNGNDLDMPALLDSHREVYLVDLDAAALSSGVDRQGVAGHPRLVLHGGVDLTGMLDAISGWTPTTSIAPPDHEALVEWPSRRVGLALPGPFDVVASTCLLSPLVGNAFHSVGERHPRFPALVRAIRAGHLRLLLDLAAPGGSALLITDVASTDTFPGLRSIEGEPSPALLRRLAEERAFFHGVDPDDLDAAIGRLSDARGDLAGVERLGPWRWSLHDRVYLVLAWRLRVRGGHPAQSLR